MVYDLPSLGYTYDALEPFMDARTMEIHYTLHHARYVKKLNSMMELCPEQIRNMTLHDVIADIKIVPEELRQGIRNNGGGHLNHSLFWQILSPPAESRPNEHLIRSIDSGFGNFTKFKEEFTLCSMDRFGSGWCWLCTDKHGKLNISSTPNQDSPIMLGHHPIMGIDLWEHAYYLKYQNNRAHYIDAFWHLVNWNKVSEIFEHFYEPVAQSR